MAAGLSSRSCAAGFSDSSPPDSSPLRLLLPSDAQEGAAHFQHGPPQLGGPAGGGAAAAHETHDGSKLETFTKTTKPPSLQKGLPTFSTDHVNLETLLEEERRQRKEQAAVIGSESASTAVILYGF